MISCYYLYDYQDELQPKMERYLVFSTQSTMIRISDGYILYQGEMQPNEAKYSSSCHRIV